MKVQKAQDLTKRCYCMLTRYRKICILKVGSLYIHKNTLSIFYTQVWTHINLPLNMPWIYKKMTECFTSKSADNDTKMSSYTEAGDIALHYIYIVPYVMRSTMYIYIFI